MRKAQGSLEYILILAAILVIAVVTVFIANSLLSSPDEQNRLNEEKYRLGVMGIEMVGYHRLYNGDAPTFPASVIYKGITYAPDSADTPFIHVNHEDFDDWLAASESLVSFNLGTGNFRAAIISDPTTGYKGLLLEGYPLTIKPPPGGSIIGIS